MNTSKHIKYLAIFQISLLIIYIILHFYFEPYLDPLLQEYNTKIEYQIITTYQIVLTMIGLPIILVFFISLFALIFKKKWAKKGYIYSSLLLLPLSLFFGETTVESIWFSAFDELEVLLNGMLIALLLYTNGYEKE